MRQKRSLRIYIEGGGDTVARQAKLRQGMDCFLKKLPYLQNQRYHWTVVSCGARPKTWEAFQRARHNYPTSINILLVDSEDPVTTPDPRQHLEQRKDDAWPMSEIDITHVHLMTQCMETWIVADPETLKKYYGQNFQTKALPKRQNLEEEPKPQIYDALKRATRDTTKGEYDKIKHASEILPKLDPSLVRKRCPHAERFFETLTALVTAETA
ncbi:DUF4276 family protein [Geminisphaera colitermitum]|uniref:DUF4276 family protein n=1 Tax=Geminisphaera colitermitum TaxID=1148786 RepID=UPI000158D285|nr:DUF4276 family protein [Geminisphaera colitermitum]